MLESNLKLILVIWLGCAAIVPFLADFKNRHAGLWFMLALVFSPLVLMVLAALRRNRSTYSQMDLGCSTCADAIEKGETRCTACDREFDLKQIDLAEVKMRLQRARGNMIVSFLFGFLALIVVGGSYVLPLIGN